MKLTTKMYGITCGITKKIAPFVMEFSQKVSTGERSVTLSGSIGRDSATGADYERFASKNENGLVDALLAINTESLKDVLRRYGVNPDSCYVLVRVKSDRLIKGWCQQPGDVDIIALNRSGVSIDFAHVVAVEVKRYTSDVSRVVKRHGNGTKQAEGLVEMGFSHPVLLHVVAQEPYYNAGEMATLQSAHPSIWSLQAPFRDPRIIEAQRRSGFGLAVLGVGQLPSVDFSEKRTAIWDSVPVATEWLRRTPEIAARGETVRNGLRSIIFTALNEADGNYERSPGIICILNDARRGRYVAATPRK